jgi:hypothetical protein
MSEPTPITQLRRHLAQLGCPARRARRIADEMADHLDDLEQAARHQGLSAADAAARAARELGDPLTLAEQHVAVLRRERWWGRHPRLGFGLVPFFAAPVLWILGWVLVVVIVSNLGRWAHLKGPFLDRPEVFGLANLAMNATNFSLLALIALWFCRRARRSALGFRWALLACAICSGYGFVSYVSLAPHSFTLGLWASAHYWRDVPGQLTPWANAAVPLLMAGAVYARRQRALAEAGAKEPGSEPAS